MFTNAGKNDSLRLPVMPKKIVICADGTWNRVDKTRSGNHISTNVAKLAAAIAANDLQGNVQELRYLEGVGTHRREWLQGGMFGLGISRNLECAYRFIVERFEPGDE